MDVIEFTQGVHYLARPLRYNAPLMHYFAALLPYSAPLVHYIGGAEFSATPGYCDEQIVRFCMYFIILIEMYVHSIKYYVTNVITL